MNMHLFVHMHIYLSQPILDGDIEGRVKNAALESRKSLDCNLSVKVIFLTPVVQIDSVIIFVLILKQRYSCCSQRGRSFEYKIHSMLSLKSFHLKQHMKPNPHISGRFQQIKK